MFGAPADLLELRALLLPLPRALLRHLLRLGALRRLRVQALVVARVLPAVRFCIISRETLDITFVFALRASASATSSACFFMFWSCSRRSFFCTALE